LGKKSDCKGKTFFGICKREGRKLIAIVISESFRSGEANVENGEE
jgi:hypothetical protein